MAKKSYHYEYFAYTDNMCYGRMLLGRSTNESIAHAIGQMANKGCYRVEKHRVCNKQSYQLQAA